MRERLNTSKRSNDSQWRDPSSRSIAALILAAVFLPVLGASPAEARPERSAVTFDIGVGAGVTPTTAWGGAAVGNSFVAFKMDDVEFAWMLPTLSIAGWLTPSVAAGARVSNFWYVPEDGEVMNGYFGAELRFMPVPEVLLAGGLGVQLLGDDERDLGPGADVRAAYLPLQLGAHGLGVFGAFTPGLIDGSFMYSAGAGLLWVMR
jgi:hypothetical protein